MASEPAPPPSNVASDGSVVNLQVVSPSVGVTRPLLFPGIAASTTVRELKGKIRETLPLRPSDENQRLIHRGRAIVRETETLRDIFGADLVCSGPPLPLCPCFVGVVSSMCCCMLHQLFHWSLR